MIDPIVRTINNLMQLRGGPVDLVATTPGVYNPDTSQVDTQVVTVTVRGLVFDAKESVSPNSLIRAGDKQVFIQPQQDMPIPVPMSVELVYGGSRYSVVVVEELNPTGANVLLYELIVRR